MLDEIFASRLISWAIFILLFPTSEQETIQQALWNVPDGNLADLSQTFIAGETLTLSWNAYDNTQYVDTTQNLVDLWVAAFDFNLNPFSQRLTAGINLTEAGNFAWTIAIPEGNLTTSAKYVLRFKVTSPIFNPNSGDLSSPGFLVLQAAQISPTTTTAPSAHPSSAVSNTSVISSSANIATLTLASGPASRAAETTNKSSSSTTSGLSGGAKGGISAGVVVFVGLALGSFSYFFLVCRRKRGKSAQVTGQEAHDTINGTAANTAEMPGKMPAAELPVNYYQ